MKYSIICIKGTGINSACYKSKTNRIMEINEKLEAAETTSL